MKKALLTAAIAVAMLGPTLAVATPAFADQTVAQSSMAMDPGMKSAMDKLHSQMSTMTPSGDMDKDYASTMHMLMAAMKGVTQAEMKGGQNPKAVQSAKEVYDMLFNKQSAIIPNL